MVLVFKFFLSGSNIAMKTKQKPPADGYAGGFFQKKDVKKRNYDLFSLIESNPFP